MKLFILGLFPVLLGSCSNNKVSTASTFCDTACTNDTITFTGTHKLEPAVFISVANCIADTLSWSHNALDTRRQMHVSTLLDKPVRLNKSAVTCFIKDTAYAWLSFNDCNTGRGYLMKLPFDKKESINKMSSAINAFDKKFVVPDDVRSYADYSTIYVVDVNTGKKEQMSFKEEYTINWEKIHDTIDSVNISRNRIFVVLNKNGEKVPMEKKISL